jgi:diaminopimelate epimerase
MGAGALAGFESSGGARERSAAFFGYALPVRIDFTKMHALGNDFMILEAPPGGALPSRAQWRVLADRHAGIGFDQALVLEPPRSASSHGYYRIYNADGSEAEQCGNGARCLARYLQMQGRASAAGTLRLGSAGGEIEARVLADGSVAVDLGVPDFNPASLPFLVPAAEATYSMEVAGENIEFGAVSIGNPHAVVRVAAVENADVSGIGAALQAHPRFPRQVNVGFMQIIDSARIRLRVYERGVGETRACGTGACAAVAVGRNLGLLGTEVEVHVPGGRLGVHWGGPGERAWLTGPAAVAYTGHAEY